MTRKKIVFVIVEGPSDDEALGFLLEKIFNRNKVYVHIMHGDITTEKNVTSGNILSKIGNLISGYAKNNHLKKLHFQEIIHIVDMDGAYIPKDAVAEDTAAKNPIYTLTKIHTTNVSGMIDRNERKREVLDRILSVKQVWGTPYQVYYMSCNLDHVLYDKLNLSDGEKEKYAHTFAKKYGNDIAAFEEFMAKSDFAVDGDYIQSWEFIRKEKHSLERHSNMCICIARARAESSTGIEYKTAM